ncbi:hypothetical protein PCANC_16854 [Puccinia coronata f. sp. avenae]|uniref:Uncharacterized protein n=1 Tax=Puccinia coronata f. sp. avenae TaxID=200324 RepID=A0A2N5SSN6_9BASI|nr:hypothetical protein PCANC_16854 [Puccinia coronata f. sp. avenae]
MLAQTACHHLRDPIKISPTYSSNLNSDWIQSRNLNSHSLHSDDTIPEIQLHRARAELEMRPINQIRNNTKVTDCSCK